MHHSRQSSAVHLYAFSKIDFAQHSTSRFLSFFEECAVACWRVTKSTNWNDVRKQLNKIDDNPSISSDHNFDGCQTSKADLILLSTCNRPLANSQHVPEERNQLRRWGNVQARNPMIRWCPMLERFILVSNFHEPWVSSRRNETAC